MATLVSFHAHPDDESIATGGTLARASAEGHRVVLVFGTSGERGEVADGFLDPGEALGERRERETRASAEVLGVHRVEFLGYQDSGMVGEATNDDPRCFWQADPAEAAERLARILAEERADVLTVYDDHGGYGHPDHIQVHRVGHRAARIAGTPRVYESTRDRDHLRALMEEAAAHEPELADEPEARGEDDFGSPAEVITTRVGVNPWLAQKRASMAAHASQIPEDSFFLRMPDEVFARAWGTEWYIRVVGEPANDADDWLVPGSS
ncbi:MAG: PIG-L family deacetylase [Acidimicrobiia bacterium]